MQCSAPNAFLVRTVYRAEKACYAWVITNKLRTDDNERNSHQTVIANLSLDRLHEFNIVKTISGQFLEETLQYVIELVSFLQKNIKVQFEELVCDFIRDQAQSWWMINVKSYLFYKHSIEPDLM